MTAPIAPLIITVGVSASGKSTFAKRLAKDNVFAHLERDILMKQVNPENLDYTPQMGLHAKELQHSSFVDAVLRGQPVVISNTHLKLSDIQEWHSAAISANYEFVVVLKVEERDILLLRNTIRQEGRVPDEVIISQLDKLQALLSMDLGDGIREAIEKGNRVSYAINGCDAMQILGYKASWIKT